MINLGYCVYLLFVERLERTRAQKRTWAKKAYAQNPEKGRAATKQWRMSNPEKYVESYSNPVNKKKQCARSKTYRRAYPEKIRVVNIAAKRRRYLRDPLYRAILSLRCRVRQALKGIGKLAKTLELLGCSSEQFRQHLENQFQPGMAWKNYGLRGWHIDHIKPCAKFDLTDPAQQRECFHFSNLQPLWALDNIKKGDTYGHRQDN